jgi:hypothetical protein
MRRNRRAISDSIFKEPKTIHVRNLAARCVRVFVRTSSLEKNEGAGNAGCLLHPQPRVRMKKAHERSHHRFRRINRHSPRNGFTAYSVLSPASEFLLSPSLAD